MTERWAKTPLSTVGESKMRYMLVRWQPSSRDSPTTVMPRSRVFFSISLPIWIDILFPSHRTWKLPVNVRNTKKRGSLDLSPVRQPEAFACPPRQIEQRKPTPICRFFPPLLAEKEYRHTSTYPVALTLTRLKVAKFQVVKTKAQVTLNQINNTRLPSAGWSDECTAKVQKKRRCYIFS